jgi:hypothetical protein
MAASLPEQKEPAEGGERQAERGRAARGRSASGQESLADLLPPDAGLDEESSGELPPDIDPFADQCRPPAVIPDGLRPPKLPHDDTLTTDVGEPKAVFADTWAWHERSAKEAIDTDSSLGELLPKAPEVGDDAEPKEGRRPAIRRRADEEEMRSMVGDDSRRVHGSEESISENPKAQATEEVLEGALDGEGGSLGGDSLEVADGRGLLPSLHEMLPDEPGSSDGGEFDLDALDVGSTIPGVESSGLRDLPDPSAGALGLDAPGLDMESLEAGWDSEDTDPWQEEASQGGEGWSVDRGPISAEHSVVSSPDQTQPPIEPERTFEPHGHPRGAVSSPGPQAEEIGKKGTEVIDTGGPGDERDTVVGHKKAAELEQLDEQQDEESEQLSGDEPKKPASGGTDPVVELIGGPGARFRAGPQRLEGERAARAFAPKEREVLEALEAETSLEEIAARLEVDIGEIARLARTGLLLGALERAGEEKGGSQPESRSVDGSGDGGEERHQDQKRRVLEMVEGVENLDYFTLLGVASDADEDEIRRAGEKLKREFSDERLPERVRQELADQIAEIRSELDDAISVLCHPRYGPAYRKALGEVAGDDKSDE